jgi:hypothetical protein
MNGELFIKHAQTDRFPMTDFKVIKVSRPKSSKGPVIVELYRNKACECKRDRNTCHCWVVKRVAPNGLELKLCDFHSEARPERSGQSQSDRCFDENPSQYSFWTDKFECYDLCWKDEETSQATKATELAQLGVMLHEADSTYARIVSAMMSFEASITRRDELTTQLAQLQSTIKTKSKPQTRDPQRDTLESVVAADSEHLETMLKQAETLWKSHILSNDSKDGDPQLGKNEVAKKRFIANISYVGAAQNQLKKSRAALESWLNKTRGTKLIAELGKLREQEQNSATELNTLERTLVSSVKTPFYEIFGTLKKYRQIPLSSGPSQRNMGTQIDKIGGYIKFYEEKMKVLSRFIPVGRHQVVFDEIVVQRETALREAAAIAAMTRNQVVQASTDSTLGQLYLTATGGVATAAQVGTVAAAAPQLIVRVKAPVADNKTVIVKPAPISVDNEPDDDDSRFDDYAYSSYEFRDKLKSGRTAGSWRTTNRSNAKPRS